MQLNFNFFHNLIFIGIALGILIGTLMLTTKRFRSLENSFLGAFLIFFSLNNLFYFLNDIGLAAEYRWVKVLPIRFSMLILLSGYFYLIVKIKKLKSISHKMLYLAIPGLLQVLYHFYKFVQYDVQNGPKLLDPIAAFLEVFSVLYALALAISLFRVLRIVKGSKKPISKNTLNWVYQFFSSGLIMVSIWAMALAYTMVANFHELDFFYPIWISISGFICVIGGKAIVKPSLFARKLSGPGTEMEISEKIDELNIKLNQEKVFKNSELTSEQLSQLLGISQMKFRELLKSQGLNFKTLINQCRVNEVKKLLFESKFDHYSIEAIGHEAGFSSKSTFFYSFRKITGMTPIEYKRSLKKSE